MSLGRRPRERDRGWDTYIPSRDKKNMTKRLERQRAQAWARQLPSIINESGVILRRPSTMISPKYGRELHSADTLLTLASDAVLSTTNTSDGIILVNPIEQGSAFYNRIGRKIDMKSLRLRFQATYQSTREAVTFDIKGNYLRYTVVYDRQPSGTLPAFDTIFGQTTGSGSTTTTVLSPLKIVNAMRFKVIRDTIVPGNALVAVEGGTQGNYTWVCVEDQYIKLRGAETVYSSTTSGITTANISTGALYVIFRAGANTTSGENQWAISANSFARLRFYD